MPVLTEYDRSVKARSMVRDRELEDDDRVDTSASTTTVRSSSVSGRTGGSTRGGGLVGINLRFSSGISCALWFLLLGAAQHSRRAVLRCAMARVVMRRTLRLAPEQCRPKCVPTADRPCAAVRWPVRHTHARRRLERRRVRSLAPSATHCSLLVFEMRVRGARCERVGLLHGRPPTLRFAQLGRAALPSVVLAAS